MNIKKISIKNFRVFKEKTTFQLRPFTILTGPNNSGKSSFIKFLLLLKEDSINLNFEKGSHNLEAYNKVLNWNSSSKKIDVVINKYNADYNYQYNEKGVLEKINFFDENQLVFEFFSHVGEDFNDTDFTGESFDENPDSYQIINVNFNLIIDSIIYRFKLEENPIANEIEKIKKELFYKVSLYDEDITHQFIEEINKFQESLFNNNKYHFLKDPSGQTNNDVYGMLMRIYKEVIESRLIMLGKRIYKITGNKDVKIEYSILGKFLFENQDVFDENLQRYFNFNYAEKLLSIFISHSEIKNETEKLHYISANRGSQKRVLENKSDSDISEIVSQFSKREYIHEDFINKCLELLDISGQVEVVRFENRISAVYVKNGENKIALADLGFGYSQVIPIILKIHNILPDSEKEAGSYYRNQTLILEEPESNLHPNLQSKLAEVLVYAKSLFKMKYIIETHSEYFIRKLQYLTAKKELKTEDSVIYYFNDDKYVTNTETKVKEIFINEDGGLTDSFGPGFFDEATKLQFDLIKLNKQQMN